ncbi:signal peptidase I [Actinomadura scrupuli]|uniref:signal peptidase I n=1 Tax=Actinomadura scrupuli TaxID=559629 RepID=UPI003D978375
MRSDTGGAVPDATQAGSGSEEAAKGKSKGSFWRELPVLIGIAVVLALVIKAFAVQAFYIPSGSMENTLEVGDRILVNKIVYHTRDVRRGDVVVFDGPASWNPEGNFVQPSNPVSKVLNVVGRAFGVAPGEKDFIKRVIGVGGDRVQCCDKQGRLMVNGHPLEEQVYLYTDPDTGEQDVPSEQKFDVTVPKGRLWVMGDHRSDSADSRYHLTEEGGGMVPVDRVIGRAFVVLWPVGRWKTLPIPAAFGGSAASGAVLPAVPPALGLAGAVPIVWIRRRRRGSAA